MEKVKLEIDPKGEPVATFVSKAREGGPEFKSIATLQTVISLRFQIYNDFNYERHLEIEASYKQKHATVLAECFQFCT